MTIIPNIYQIDKSHYQLKALTDTPAIIRTIVKAANSKQGLAPFDPEKVSTFKKDEFTYFLYVTNTDEKESDWIAFFPTELTEKKNFIQQKVSLILFIETEFQLYVIVGGSAFKMVVAFIDHSFGLNAYDRIIEPDKDELTSIKTRGITGQRIGMNEQFRNEYRIINFTRFGKLPKEIHVKLCKETTNLYFPYLKTKEKDRIQITVGAGFKIGRQIDFDDLHQIIQDMSIINTLTPKEYLSSYKQITNADEIFELRKLLVHKLYNNLAILYNNSKETSDRFDFDFCNPNNIEKFYEADTYELKERTEDGGYKVFTTVDDREDIFRKVMDRAMEVIGQYNEYKFSNYLWSVLVAAIKGDKTVASSGFLHHFSAEFNKPGESIFLIDTKWFYLKDQFITDMITNAQHIFKTYKAPDYVLKFPWDKGLLPKESDYNKQYDAEPNCILCDTLIVDGVELCDILYYDDKNLYLVHVKAGFGSQVRELSNQVMISARRLKEALNAKGNDFLENYYNKLIKSKHNINNLNLDEFKGLFKKSISYIIAVNSTLVDDLAIEDNMIKYNSNIARFSLIQCSNEMQANYYPLLTYQIPRK
jgi:uncharacterized protein (TIGR04141 family)